MHGQRGELLQHRGFDFCNPSVFVSIASSSTTGYAALSRAEPLSNVKGMRVGAELKWTA